MNLHWYPSQTFPDHPSLNRPAFPGDSYWNHRGPKARGGCFDGAGLHTGGVKDRSTGWAGTKGFKGKFSLQVTGSARQQGDLLALMSLSSSPGMTPALWYSLGRETHVNALKWCLFPLLTLLSLSLALLFASAGNWDFQFPDFLPASDRFCLCCWDVWCLYLHTSAGCLFFSHYRLCISQTSC